MVNSYLGLASDAGVPDELPAPGAAAALSVAAAEAVEAGRVARQEPEAVRALVEAARRRGRLQALAAEQEATRGTGEATAHKVEFDINCRTFITFVKFVPCEMDFAILNNKGYLISRNVHMCTAAILLLNLKSKKKKIEAA